MAKRGLTLAPPGVSPRNAKDAESEGRPRRLARSEPPGTSPPADRRTRKSDSKTSRRLCVLSDPRKRAIYDQYGFYAGQHPGAAWQARTPGLGAPATSTSQLRNHPARAVFGPVLGPVRGGSRVATTAQGRGLDGTSTYPSWRAFRGLATRLHINRHEACTAAAAGRADRTRGQQVCQTCQGSGEEMRSRGNNALSGPCRRMRRERRISGRAPCAAGRLVPSFLGPVQTDTECVIRPRARCSLRADSRIELPRIGGGGS